MADREAGAESVAVAELGQQLTSMRAELESQSKLHAQLVAGVDSAARAEAATATLRGSSPSH